MITLVIDKHLGLVLQTTESGGMDDPVTITLKGRACLGFWFIK